MVPLPSSRRTVRASRMYVSRGGISQLYLRSIKEVEGRPLANTQRAVGPFFAPDGIWLGFFRRWKTQEGFYGHRRGRGPRRDRRSAGTGRRMGHRRTRLSIRGRMELAEIAASGGASRPLLPPEQIAAHVRALSGLSSWW